jgi:uncharacterized protein (DUF1778 family)
LQNKHAQEAAARKKVERKGAVRPWENSGPPEPARTPEATKAAEPARTPEATKTAKPATMGAGTGKTGEAPKAAVFGASKTDLEIDPDSVALLNMCAKIGAEAAVRYFVLKRIADKSEGILAVSQVGIASLFNISDQSVKRLFAALEEAGLLSLLKDYDPREGSPRIYKFI